MEHESKNKEKVQFRNEVLDLKRDILMSLRNGLVLPNTMLQTARERQLSFDESEDASKCLHASIAAIEHKFITFLNSYPS